MNRNESMPAVILYYFGWILTIAGVVAGLYLGFTLDLPKDGYTYLTDPHPLRWVYGFSTMIGSAVFGLILVGISEIIAIISEKSYEHKELQKSVIRRLDEIIKKDSAD